MCNQMVVDTHGEATDADRVFHALSDPTRRDIVMRAMTGEHSVSAIARYYPMSLTAVQKHVAVLEKAGLVSKRRRGRERVVRTEIQALRRAHLALDEIEQVWRARVERFGEVLADTTRGVQP
jgi:DNA-binding transcriptional ArsR family regulator